MRTKYFASGRKVRAELVNRVFLQKRIIENRVRELGIEEGRM